MKYLFYVGHPAQYLFVRSTIRQLAASPEHRVTLLIKSKDVLEDLVRKDQVPYRNIQLKERRKGRLSILTSFLSRLLTLLPILLRTRPNLLIATDATVAQLGRLLGINRITIIEDDYEVIRNLARLNYPFTQTILCPEACGVGPYEAKKVGYKGYMKLAYLHPNVFTPDEGVRRRYGLTKPYVLIRLSALNAHHDFGIRGLTPSALRSVIDLVQARGYEVRLSAEADRTPEFAPYRLRIEPSDMHHVLAQASMLICDSQSMCVEAAMLGVPSLRYSDFVGRISVLEELEHTYQLTVGIPAGREEQLLDRLRTLLADPNLPATFQARRHRMLNEKIDVSAFLTWFLAHYPRSLRAMQRDPGYQTTFLPC